MLVRSTHTAVESEFVDCTIFIGDAVCESAIDIYVCEFDHAYLQCVKRSFVYMLLHAALLLYLGREALCQQLVQGGANLLWLQVETAAELLVLVLDVPEPDSRTLYT